MTTITFDTLAYVKTLREAGFTEPQAEAQVSALANVLKSGAGELATKQDLRDLALATKQDIDLIRKDMAITEERTRGRFTLLQWMMGTNLVVTLAILWILIKGAH